MRLTSALNLQIKCFVAAVRRVHKDGVNDVASDYMVVPFVAKSSAAMLLNM